MDPLHLFCRFALNNSLLTWYLIMEKPNFYALQIKLSRKSPFGKVSMPGIVAKKTCLCRNTINTFITKSTPVKHFIFLLLLLVGSFQTYSQSPVAFNYQAVLRDAAGAVKANTNASVRIDLL